MKPIPCNQEKEDTERTPAGSCLVSIGAPFGLFQTIPTGRRAQKIRDTGGTGADWQSVFSSQLVYIFSFLFSFLFLTIFPMVEGCLGQSARRCSNRPGRTSQNPGHDPNSLFDFLPGLLSMTSAVIRNSENSPRCVSSGL